MMLAAVAKFWNQADHRYFIGGSITRTIMGDEAALLRLWGRKWREAEPQDLSGKPHHPAGTLRGARSRPPASPVRAAHAEFVAALAGHPPRPIPLEADPLDLEDRAD